MPKRDRADDSGKMYRPVGLAYLAQILDLSAPLIFGAVAARSLGVARYGKFAMVQAICSVAVAVVGLGLAVPLTARLVKTDCDPRQARELFGIVVTLRLICACALFPLAMATTWIVLGPQMLACSAVVLLLTLGTAALTAQPIYQAKGAYHRYTLWSATARLAGVLLGLIIFGGLDDYVTAALAFYVAPLLATICLGWHWYSRPTSRIGPHQVSGAVSLLRDGFQMLRAQFCQTSCTAAGPLILGMTHGSAATGLYAIADRIMMAARAAINPIAGVLLPRAMKLATLRSDGAWINATTTYYKLFPLFALICIVQYMCAPLAVTVLAGGEYSGSILIVRVLSPLLVFALATNLFGSQGLVAAGHFRLYSKTILGCALLYLSMMPFAAQRYGALGVAVSVVTWESVIALSCVILLRPRRSRTV